MEENSLNPTSLPDRALIAASTPAPLVKKKRKGPKGPNPLSVMKKKPKPRLIPEPIVAETKTKGDAREQDAKEMKAGQKRSREDGEGEPHDESHSRKRRRRRRRKDTTVEAPS
jgi:U3 small nucleolar RNA-associated protein 23